MIPEPLYERDAIVGRENPDTGEVFPFLIKNRTYYACLEEEAKWRYTGNDITGAVEGKPILKTSSLKVPEENLRPLEERAKEPVKQP